MKTSLLLFAPFVMATAAFAQYGCVPAASLLPPVTVIVQTAPAEMAPPPLPPPPAHPVMHEYNWSDEAKGSAGNPPTYTIALKNGYWRIAVIAWVQDGKLHYIDPEHKHQALSSDVIDREATARVNQQKNLHLELPPG